MDTSRYIRIQGARQHNLKNVSIDIPRDSLVVMTGLSGSGKSSLAFDTIYAEGQRKYIETLSAYARQFLEQLQKPDVDHVEGLPPTIAIEQRSGSGGPRSTVATTTEIYDYLRLLFARVGQPHCWVCGQPIDRQTTAQIVDAATALPAHTRIMVLAPLVRGKKGEHAETFRQIQREGFVRVRVDGQLHDVKLAPKLSKTRKHTIDVVVDRLVVRPEIAARLADSVNLALGLGNDTVIIAHEIPPGEWQDTPYSARFACPLHPEANLPELSPRLFSFNSPHGACPTCDGLGHVLEFDPGLVVPDETLSLAQGAVAAWRKPAGASTSSTSNLPTISAATSTSPPTYPGKISRPACATSCSTARRRRPKPNTAPNSKASCPTSNAAGKAPKTNPSSSACWRS